MPVAAILAAVPTDARYEGEAPCTLEPARVGAWADRMLEAMSLNDAELSVLLCDEVVMRELNRQYRGEDRATDVLAFSLLEGEGVGAPGLLALGDVVVSLPVAQTQADRAQKDLSAEVKMLLAHGILHLLGFDHAEPNEARRMRSRTDLLISSAPG